MNRRQFLQTIPAFALTPVPQVKSPVQFSVGLVPPGKTAIATGVHDFWNHCDEVSAAVAHRIEFNNTRAMIAEAYVARAAELREGLAARSVSLVALAQFSRMDKRENSAAILQQHLLLGELLSSVDGKFITHMIAPTEVLNESQDEAAYRRIDLSVWAQNANEVGRQVYERSGVKLAYHPEQREVSLGIYQRFLEATDPRYVHFVADVGHLAAGGANPVQVCQRYRSSLLAVHLKDFSPTPPDGRAVKAGNVAFGEGNVDLRGIVTELRRSHFTGWVMGESGGTNQQMCEYMTQTLGLQL